MLAGRVEAYGDENQNLTLRTGLEKELLQSPFGLFPGPFLIGANMVIKQEVLDCIGEFDITLGPGSRFSAVAEDLDFVYRALIKGLKIVYSPNVVVYHNHARIQKEDIQKAMHGYTVGKGAFYAKHALADKRIAKMAYWGTKDTFLRLAKKLFSGESGKKELFYLYALFLGVISRLARTKAKNKS